MRILLLAAVLAGVLVPVSAAQATVPFECTAAALSGSMSKLSGAMGTDYGDLRLTNVSTGACWVQGYGGLSFVRHRGGAQVGEAAERTPSSHPRVIIAPGDSVVSRVAIASVGPYDPATCHPTPVAGFRVFPPDSKVSKFVRFPVPTMTCANRTLVMLRHKAFRRA